MHVVAGGVRLKVRTSLNDRTAGAIVISQANRTFVLAPTPTDPIEDRIICTTVRIVRPGLLRQLEPGAPRAHLQPITQGRRNGASVEVDAVAVPSRKVVNHRPTGEPVMAATTSGTSASQV